MKPVVCPQRGARPQQFIIGDAETELELSLGSRSFLDCGKDNKMNSYTEAESELSLGSRSFLDMVNDQVRNDQCLFHIVFEYTPGIHDQGKMLVLPNQLLC